MAGMYEKSHDWNQGFLLLSTFMQSSEIYQFWKIQRSDFKKIPHQAYFTVDCCEDNWKTLG